MTDKIPKLICHNCCSLAIELYKFRQIALANDKTLKALVNQPYKPGPTDRDGLHELQDSILQRMSEARLSATASEFFEKDEEPREKRTYPKESIPNYSYSSSGKRNIGPKSKRKKEEYPSSSGSDEENLSIATLKRKYRAAKKRDSKHPPYFFSDSDSDLELISKRNKRNKYYIDDDYSGCESESNKSIRKEKRRPQRGKAQAQEIEATDDKSPDKHSGSEQKYVSEPYSKYCEYCDRYFWGNSQLKAHQRVHFRCQFCVKGFESHEILQEHLMNVCFKTITRRKSFIPLIRVDNNVKLLETYKAAFDEYFEDIADGVYGDPELIKNPSVKFHLFHTESHRIAEKKIIEEIFVKFEHLDNTPVQKNELVQTKRLQTDVTYTNSNQIILDDANKDLRLFDIPIYLVIDRIQSAYISFVKPPRDKRDMQLWPAGEVKDVSKKPKTGIFYSNELTPEQMKMQANKNVMAPRVPMNVGPRKPFNNLGAKMGFEPRTKQFMPRSAMSNVRMNNQSKVIGVPRTGQNIIRKPVRAHFIAVKTPNVVPRVLYRSPAPIQNITTSKSEIPNHFKTPNMTSSNIINNSISNQKISQNTNEIKNTKILQTISNEISLQRTNSPKTINTTQNEANPSSKVINIVKNVPNAVIVQIAKPNFKQTVANNESRSSPTILNISNSVTLEKNLPKQNNPPIQNNLISYPPRPNTAIRNMLESISGEISIEPNYQRQNQNPAGNVSSVSNVNSNVSNVTTFATPTTVTYKPNRITYPRPIPIKEEFSEENDGFNNQSMPEQSTSTLYDMDYPIKEEHELDQTQNFVKPETDESSYTSNMYQGQSQVNFNAGYSQEPSSINYNQQQQQQYYRPQIARAANLPTVRHRFAVTQPYRNMEYRPTNHLNIYQPRLNQPISNMPSSTVSSNALVPANSYNANDFISNNVYNRPYSDNYNNYNNMFQTPQYQNQYAQSYNAQAQPAVDYNNTYTESTTSETDSKFLRIKQPWELFR